MNKLLIICGPTATGKTSLGVHLAKRLSAKGGPASGWGGEIVSADSRQIYKGMDIGTGKDIERGKWVGKGKNAHWTVEGIPFWMLDVIKPNQEFSVAQYVELAQKALSDIEKRKKLPIIVGGTGLYIKGLVDGIETLGVEPDWELRSRLEGLPAPKLFDLLARLDPGKAASMNASDRENPRRLIRAVEIANTKTQKKSKTRKKRKALFIGLKAEHKELYKRIDKRVEERVKMGVEKETKKLIKKGYSWNLPAMSAMGYQEWQPFFEDKATKEEVIQKWKFNEHGYARRQLTWFKKDKRIKWFDIKPLVEKEVEKLVKSWYTDLDVK